MVSMMMIISVPLYKHTQVVWPVQDEITEKKEKNKPADLRINVFCLLFLMMMMMKIYHPSIKLPALLVANNIIGFWMPKKKSNDYDDDDGLFRF